MFRRWFSLSSSGHLFVVLFASLCTCKTVVEGVQTQSRPEHSEASQFTIRHWHRLRLKDPGYKESIKVAFNIPLTSRQSGVSRSKRRMCRPSVSSDGQGEAYRPFFTVASSTSVIHSAGPAMHADPVACYHFHFPCFYFTFTFPVLFNFHFTFFQFSSCTYRPFFTMVSSHSVIHSAGMPFHSHFPCLCSTYTFHIFFNKKIMLYLLSFDFAQPAPLSLSMSLLFNVHLLNGNLK